MRHGSVSLYAFTAILVLTATPAFAQFQLVHELGGPPLGERYHVEASTGFWSPSPDMAISSESLGIQGSTIDFQNDLGLSQKRFGELHLVFRPVTKHKLRLQYIPIDYVQSATLNRSLVFNGQSYKVGLPVNSELHWKALRLAYEYDFITTNRAFGGFIFDVKYTDIRATLESPITTEYAEAKAPIPAIGGIVRVFPIPNVSLTGEVTGFKIPESASEKYRAKYVDFDVYGTFNFIENVGAQIGYRSFDMGYLVKKDVGSFTLKGMYFGIVARY